MSISIRPDVGSLYVNAMEGAVANRQRHDVFRRNVRRLDWSDLDFEMSNSDKKAAMLQPLCQVKKRVCREGNG